MSGTLSLSSITKKIWMSLFGIFLMTFLVVHLSINLLLLFDPSRELFNIAAHFMGTNPIIQTFQWVLFAGFIVHIILGVILQVENWMARPKGYKVKGSNEESVFSKYMIYTGAVIFIFLAIHLTNFFLLKMRGEVPPFHGGAEEMEDMGLLVVELFKSGGYVIFYVVMLLLMGFHLDHAFQSAFQSLGLSHPKYTPFIKGLGHVYSVVITLGYIIIPLVIYFK